jgi:hypothetical protein
LATERVNFTIKVVKMSAACLACVMNIFKPVGRDEIIALKVLTFAVYTPATASDQSLAQLGGSTNNNLL